MRKLVLTCIASGICLVSGYAQTLFTYGKYSVEKDDFLRVYKKNSLNKAPDMSDTALKSYLDLYALFRMKVAEAEKQKLDTVPAIDHELDNYRKQLSKNYLTDDQVTNKLIHEVYDRMKENVHVAHILISCTPGSDTTLAYKKIDSIYHLIDSKKVDFETMAKQFSDDKGSKDNGGDVGYFTALQTVYPFENVAYSTSVGKVSKPFRTQFGYHILKVIDKRADRGQVKVAQILIQVPKSKGETGIETGRKRADSVEAMLKNGESFDDMVRKYSDDKFTVNDFGVMKPFGVGRMVPAFENAAFALKKPGDISAPVQTDYGFHIIKLIEKYPLAPYDSLFTQLKHKVENDSRAQTAKEHFFNKIKEKNGFKEYPENITEVTNKLMSIPDTGKNAKTFTTDDYRNMNKPVFTMAGKNYLQHDFVKFMETLTHGKINGPKNAVINDAYNLYVNNVVNDFEEHKLVDENPEFKSLMEEYRDGIMLFELMDRNVWSKAAHDSVGLKEFYEKNKSKYLWDPGFEGSVYKFKNKAMYDTAMMIFDQNSNITDEDLAKAINTQKNPDGVTIQRGRYEFSRFKDATAEELEHQHKKVTVTANGLYTLIAAKQVYTTPGQKTLDEARGYVVAEYQDYLEKQWNEKMRNEYPLKVNEKVFNRMVKK
ncbi:MAG: peptidylprolyl isomerase [Chitinophagales bacterium]